MIFFSAICYTLLCWNIDNLKKVAVLYPFSIKTYWIVQCYLQTSSFVEFYQLTIVLMVGLEFTCVSYIVNVPMV